MTQQQLAEQQKKIGQAGAVAQGAAGLLDQGLSMVSNAKNINTTSPTEMVDAFGKPLFNLGGFASQVAAIKPKGASGSDIASGAVTGASAGAAFGPWGAAIGGVVGGASAAIFGRRKKKVMEKKRRLAQNNLFNAQRLFNSNMDTYNSNQMAQSLYQDSLNQGNRMSAVYQAL